MLSPEGRQVFPDFTVLDNLLMGGYLQNSERNEETLKTVYELFPRLKEREAQAAGPCPEANSRCWPSAVPLMGKPRLLMLDEPLYGTCPAGGERNLFTDPADP